MHDNARLAIEGGAPVRTMPLPAEFPGAHWINEAEVEAVTRVVRSRSPFRYYGPDLQGMATGLEESFRNRLGRKHALAISSATAGLYAAMSAMQVGPGDEVLIPGFLWVSCIAAVVRRGAIPRLVDIDETFCMDPEDLRRKITPRCKAALVVHMSGACGRLDEIMSVCREAKIPLIEDCAQAAGGTFRGKPLGSFGEIALFSFQLNKNMTSGEGGMIVCDSEEHYRHCEAIHDLGYPRINGRLDSSDERYQTWGIGARMGEMPAAMALVQHEKLPRIVAAMHKSKWAIRKALEGIEGLRFRHIVDQAGDASAFLITLMPTSEIADRFALALKAEGLAGAPGTMACYSGKEFGLHWYFNSPALVAKRGVTTGGWPWTDAHNAFARDYSYGRGALKVCDDLERRSVFLTVASCLSERDVADIVAAYRKVAGVLLRGK